MTYEITYKGDAAIVDAPNPDAAIALYLVRRTNHVGYHPPIVELIAERAWGTQTTESHAITAQRIK